MHDRLFSRSKDLMEVEVDGEVVGLDVGDGACYGFNETASIVWNLLERPRRFAELRDHLLARYAVDGERCEAELGALLQQLETDGLLTSTDA